MAEARETPLWKRLAGPLAVLALCTLALAALHRELHTYHLHDIRRRSGRFAPGPGPGRRC
jgi:hypothetical protein